MDPAFKSTRQAAAFALLLFACLTAPLVLRALHRPAREATWSTTPSAAGPFSHIHHEVFEERGDIDILFIGSSFLWAGIDVPHVERELSKQLGRKATVLSLSSNWWGEDLTYLLLRDLLARRRVHMVVFSLPPAANNQTAPHPCSAYWYTGEDPRATAGLPLRHRLQLYAEEVLGAPRHLLGLLRRDLLEPSPYAASRGAGRFREALPGQTFVRFLDARAPSLAAEDLILSERTRDRFHFDGVPLVPFQDHFARLRVQLAREHGARIAVVHVPQRPTGAPSPTVDERMDWSRHFGADVAVIGVAPATLFAGLSSQQIDAHYYNEHLNLNGAERLTRTLTPALLQIHGQTR